MFNIYTLRKKYFHFRCTRSLPAGKDQLHLNWKNKLSNQKFLAYELEVIFPNFPNKSVQRLRTSESEEKTSEMPF